MTIDEMIEVLQAYKSGETLQIKSNESANGWIDLTIKPPTFNFFQTDYRVKPKPMEIYVNVFGNTIGSAHTSKEDARSVSNGKVVKFIEVIE